MNNFLKFLSLPLIVILLIGCYGIEDTAMMILKGKNPEGDRKEFYVNNKARIDKFANEILTKIAQGKIAKVSFSDDEKAIYSHNYKRLDQLVIKEVDRLSKEGKMAYRRIKGNLGIFDISDKVYKWFGFHPGDRIQTKWGKATVIGILEGDDKLWFHIDGKNGASFWSKINEKDFKLMKSSKKKIIKVDSMDKENKTSFEAWVEDGMESNSAELAESSKKSVYLLGEVIPPIQPILN